MDVGTRLIAPEGYGGLAKDEPFFLLASRPDPARVLIVHLWERPSSKRRQRKVRALRRATILALPRAAFENAVRSGHIVRSEEQPNRPPWLEEFDGDEIRARFEGSDSDRERVRKLVQKLPSEGGFEGIVTGRNPTAMLNRLAEQLGTNKANFRLSFCVYYLFGQKPEMLMSLKFRSGRYDRQELPADGIKLGRPSKILGKLYGGRLSRDDKDAIEAHYRKNAGLGISKASLYTRCVKEVFGCRATGDKWKKLYHPGGGRFPTRRQYDYVLRQRIGAKQVREARFGAETIRNKEQGSRGSFNEQVGNLLERLEADGYTVDTHPTGFAGLLLPKLTVVRIIDCASRMRLGIGFSMNGERAEAYSMALVCMAMDKVKFCELFGLEIGVEEWPSKGWPVRQILDRGPGSVIDMDSIPFTELSPAYAGQSKAVVESSHPKNDKTSGAPSYLRSSCSPIQLAVEEIKRLMVENNAVKVARTPAMIAKDVVPVPVGVWAFLDRFGRKNGYANDESKAIELLPSIEVVCTKGGITFYGQRYFSPELRDSGLLDVAAREGQVSVKAHIMPLCVRQFWVKWKGKLINAKWALPIDDGDVFMTLDEMKELARLEREDNVRLGVHRHAVEVDMEDRFEQTFDRRSDRVKRVSGRPKVRGEDARNETRAIKKIAEAR